MAVIQLVLAVGLSVDYAAHVGHSFMLKAGTRDERMVQVIRFVFMYIFFCGMRAEDGAGDSSLYFVSAYVSRGWCRCFVFIFVFAYCVAARLIL